MRHAESERGRAAGTAEEPRFPNAVSQRSHLGCGDGKTPAVYGRNGGLCRLAEISAGEFTATYSPGSIAQTAIIAVMAKTLSQSIALYPTGLAWDSRAIISGVVPEAISA
jgi:hypothetical protein